MLGALTRIREAAENHMDELDELGHVWAEETVTDVSVHRGHPHVRVIKFTRRQEGTIGADYLWWFLDQVSSTCFGMLVQAKRLTRGLDAARDQLGHSDPSVTFQHYVARRTVAPDLRDILDAFFGPRPPVDT